MTTFDEHRNLALGTVSAGSTIIDSATGDTIVAASDAEAAEFPAVPFFATVWRDQTPAQPAVEIVRATTFDGARTFTVLRAQQGTAAQLFVSQGWKFANTITVADIVAIEDAVTGGEAGLAAETAARESADTALQGDISAEATARAAGDAATLSGAEAYADGKVSAEASARAAGDAATLASAEGYADGEVAAEAGTRASSDSTLQAHIDSEATARASGDAAALANSEGYTDGQVAAEAGLRVSGDAATLASAEAYTDSHLTSKVSGPGSSVDGHFAQFSGTGGETIEDTGLLLDTDGTLDANSDLHVPTQKAVKTAIANSGSITHTAAAWTALNTVLLLGQFGVESDTYSLKVGDGVTAWNSLEYAVGKSNPWLPDNAICVPFDRSEIDSSSTLQTLGLASGTPRFCGGQGFVLPAGKPVKSIAVTAGVTDLATGTHQWFALCDMNYNVLAVTLDDVNQAWAGHVTKRLKLARYVSDGAMTSGSAVLTSATAAFTAADVGQQVTVAGAGAAGVQLGNSVSPVTILSVQSATQATVSVAASTTVSGALTGVATPYLPSQDTGFYIAIMVTAGTMPTLIGKASTTGFDSVLLVAPYLAGTSTTTGLTTPVAVGTALNAPTSTSAQCWCYPRNV